MNRTLVILAVTGAIVLAGCARMLAQNPKSEPMRASPQVEVAQEAPRAAALKPEASRATAPKQETSRATAPKPKPKAVPRTPTPRR